MLTFRLAVYNRSIPKNFNSRYFGDGNQFQEIYPRTVAPDSATCFLHTPLNFQKALKMYCHVLPHPKHSKLPEVRHANSFLYVL